MLRVAPLLLLAGCLYTDDLNHRPAVSIHAVSAQPSDDAPYVIGSTIEIDSQPSDEEDGVDLRVEFRLADETGATPSPCRAQLKQTSRHAQVSVYVAGTYTVYATSIDTEQARSLEASTKLQVVDAPAKLSLTGVIQSGPRPTECSAFTAGVPALVWYDGLVSDLRGTARPPDNCPSLSPVAIHWNVSGATPAFLSLAQSDGNCAPLDLATAAASLAAPDYHARVCLWSDPMAPDTAHVTFSAAIDGDDASLSRDVSFLPNQQPCLVDERPPAGHYVIDRSQPFLAQVSRVDDDRDGYGSPDSRLGFVWSVWRRSDAQPDGVWSELPPSDQAAYELDASNGNVGDTIKLRVEVVDRSGVRGSCATDAPVCCITSCAAPADTDACPAGGQCQKWKTWDLELR